MSARYEITLCDTRVEITDPWGCVLTIYDGAHEMTAGAIRQQSADIAELRAELAAAVAENAALLAANRDCILHFDAMKLRAEQSEARLVAIDAAPVVASVGHGDYLHRHTASVPVGTLLIARPAKD